MWISKAPTTVTSITPCAPKFVLVELSSLSAKKANINAIQSKKVRILVQEENNPRDEIIELIFAIEPMNQ